eukprot:RCo014693
MDIVDYVQTSTFPANARLAVYELLDIRLVNGPNALTPMSDDMNALLYKEAFVDFAQSRFLAAEAKLATYVLAGSNLEVTSEMGTDDDGRQSADGEVPSSPTRTSQQQQAPVAALAGSTGANLLPSTASQ